MYSTYPLKVSLYLCTPLLFYSLLFGCLQDGCSALSIANYKENVEIVRTLLAHGAAPDPRFNVSLQNSLLFLHICFSNSIRCRQDGERLVSAAREGDAETVQFCLLQNTNINAVNQVKDISNKGEQKR